MLLESTASRSSSLMLTSVPSPPPPEDEAASLAAVSSRSFAASASISATRARMAASSAASASSSAASDEGAAGAGAGAEVGAEEEVEAEGGEEAVAVLDRAAATAVGCLVGHGVESVVVRDSRGWRGGAQWAEGEREEVELRRGEDGVRKCQRGPDGGKCTQGARQPALAMPQALGHGESGTSCCA